MPSGKNGCACGKNEKQRGEYMFSDNNKISIRQIFRLFVFDFVGESTLILPSALAGFSGNDGLFSILLGGVLGSLYLCYLTWVMKRMGTDIISFMERTHPLWLQKLIYLILLIHFVGMSGYGAYMFSDVMKRGLINEESYTLILILVLLVAGYAVCGGIESRARVYEILFVVLFVLLAVMLLLAAKDVEPRYLEGFFQAPPQRVLEGSLTVFFCLMPLFLVLFFPAYVEKKNWGKMTAAVYGALWFTVGVLGILYVILLASFGSASLSTMRYPVITLMSSIHLRGSFLKRLDAFMIGIWFFTLFALVTVFLFYGQELAQKVIGKEGKKRYLVSVMGLVFLVAEVLYFGESGENFRNYLIFVGAPLLLFLPILLLIVQRITQASDNSGKGGEKSEK